MPRTLSASSGQFGVGRSVWDTGALFARRFLVFLLTSARLLRAARVAVRNLDEGHAVDAALRHRDVPVREHAHVADDAAAARNDPALELLGLRVEPHDRDRKSTRLNSSHITISYA